MNAHEETQKAINHPLFTHFEASLPIQAKIMRNTTVTLTNEWLGAFMCWCGYLTGYKDATNTLYVVVDKNIDHADTIEGEHSITGVLLATANFEEAKLKALTGDDPHIEEWYKGSHIFNYTFNHHRNRWEKEVIK